MIIIDINGNKRDCVSAVPDKDFPGYIKVLFKNQLRSHVEWFPVEEFKEKNPDLSLFKNYQEDEPHEDLGIVFSSTKTSLMDKKKNWESNIYTNIPVWISRGKGEGQVRTAVSNNKNSVTIDKPWTELPDPSSQYVISSNIHNPHVFGNSLPVMEKTKRKIKKKKK